MTLTMSDFFCGAGGSSTGAVQVPGVELRFAANHWKLAVDVHNANHPDALHAQADISQYEPRLAPRTDIAWFSPSCTNHSVAQGKSRREIDGQPDLFGEVLPDAAAERSRATMWDVVRYSEHHRYRIVLVENVLEATKWVLYRSWLTAMDALGYDHEALSINSMHAQHGGLPAPQSRDRVYWVFWRRGDRRPDVEKIQRPDAYCPHCDTVVAARKSWKNGRTVGRYRAQYVFVCSTPGCGRPVEPGWLPASSAIDWSIPGTRIGDRDRPLAEKTRARIAAGIARYWRAPWIVDNNHVNRGRRLDEPMPTMTTATTKALAVPVECRVGNGMVTPFIAELRGGGSDARSVSDPLSTVTASGNHHGLVTPYYGRSAAASTTDQPLGTVTTVDRYALVMRNNTARGDDGQMSTPVHEVMRTITTTGNQSLIMPGDVAAAQAQVDDCLFRMIEPPEAANTMAFPRAYMWDGTRRERMRLTGNAVCPPNARDLIGASAEALLA